MDVRLPNGTIIRNVPEGTSKTDLMSKLVANGYDQSIFSAVGKEPEIAPDNYPKLAAVADVPLSFGRGAVTGVKMIADAFGADNPVSQTLSSVDTTLESLMSAQSKKDAQEVSRIMNEAKDKGVWEQVKAGLNALTVAPIDLVTNAFGTAAPTALAGLLAAAAAPELAIGTAVGLTVGAVSGAGTIKDRIYTDVKQVLTDQGVAPEKAEAAAQEAQAYEGKNLDQILLGTLFGAGAAISGVEKTLVKGLTSKILGNAAKEAVDVTEQAAAKGLTGRFVEGAVKEAVPEALQEAQEQIASNIAQQREGVDVPTFRGAASSATLGGVTGGLLGGGLNVAVEPGPRTVDKSAEDDALLKALKVHAADVVAGKDVFLLEDKTGNRLLDFANSQRDAVPSLGPILDSNAPRDVKLNLINTRLSEAGLGNVPEEPISLKGILALPAPEIKKSENLRQVFNNALDIAERSATPATEMSVDQGPEGYRIVGMGGKVMSDPINSEREANVVLEGLRRSYDMKQSEDYKIASADYRDRFDSEMADATLRAAKETMQPLMPVTMEEINNTIPELAAKIQDSRRIDPDTKKTKQAIMSDVSFDEMRKRGATKDELFEIALMQQPYTGGTGRLRPGIEQDILGNRPSAPAQTARTPDELARLKLAEVTPGGNESRFFFSKSLINPYTNSPYLFTNVSDLQKTAGFDGDIAHVDLDKNDPLQKGLVVPANKKNAFITSQDSFAQIENVAKAGTGEDVGEMEFARAVKEKPSDAQQAFVEREGTAPAKPLRPEREVYPELPPAPRPSEEEVAQARQLIEDRVAKLEAIGKQGQAIGKGVRDALASSNFTPDQMLQAFKVADISGRLIGKTEADPHSFQFVERIATPSGGAARGARINPTEKLKGVIKIALDPKYHADLVKTTSAHESFHVLQDLFAAYDKAGAAVINNAFKGAKTLDDIDANLLRKLKSLRDPDTNKSVYNTIKDQVPQSVFDSYAQPVREREMQAYVFGYLDNAIVNGNQSVSGLGAAFVRFLNFLGRFKDRVGNYYKGLGYQTAEDVMSGTVRGKRQAGIGVAGELVKKALPGEDTEFSRADPSKVPLQDRIPGLKGVWPYLTSDERERLITTSAKNLVKRFDELPSSAEMAAVAFSGRAKRGWYYNSAKALINIFGLSDGRRFAALLAATSPQTSVQSNLINALNIWKNWVNAGRPTDRKQILSIMGQSVEGSRGEDSVLDAWKNNTIRALATKDAHLINLDISGPKVNSFMKNLWGVTQEVTNDAWIANYAGVDQKIFARAPGPEDELGVVGVKSTGYMAMSAVTRKAASILSKKTGKTWTPDEVQETVWSWAKALYEMRRGRGKDTTTKALLRQGELTADRVNAVPDFEILFVQNVYRKILEDAGYGEQVGRQAEIVQERGAGSTGDGTRINAFDAENSGFAQPDFQRHLLRAAGRLEELYQTRLSAGEPEGDVEFSQAINATGQRAEAKVNSERYDQIWSKVREFFNPLALVNNLPQFLSFRNIATGSVTSSEKYARKMADLIAKGTLEDRNAVYTYMTTRGASPSSIKSPEVRKAAIEAKNAVNKMAEVMIARKELTEESFEKYYDRYLPRIYLMFEETGRGMKSPLGGRSAREYLEMRDEKLTKEQREILGEIKDPSYLTYVALSRPARDMAMTDYLNSIMIFGADPKNQWVAPQSYVQYEGKSYTPYYLLTMVQDLLSAAKRAEDIAPDQSAAMKKEALKIQDVAVSAQIDLETKIDGITSQGYTQLPKRRQYGTLAGAVVQNGIYQDLVGTFIPVGKENRSLIDRLIGDEYSTLGKGVALWKLGKTTLNPPTQVVNFISNGISLNLFGGVPIHKYPELVKKTITEIKNNGKLWQEAQKYGISGGTMSQAELQKAFVRINRYQGRTEGEGTLMNMFTTSKILAATFVEGAGDVYQASETLFKMMKFIYGVETEKLSPSEAVNAANDILFDYSLVNNNIRWLRNAPLGLPFITYYYKVLPKIIETLYKHPERFIPYVALAYALPALTMATFDLDDDELEKLRLSAQDYIRDKGTLFFLPYRDGKGNIQFVDVGKYLPFSTLLSPFMTAYNSGDIVKAGRELLTPVTPGGPVITAIAALATGRDPFTDKEIMDPRDTTKNQAFSLFSYIFNQAMPPAIGFDLKNLENSAGAIPALYNSLFTDGTGVDKRGMPKPETLEAAARLLGLNITPLKADVQRIQNLNYMMSQINKTKAYQTEVSKDQSLTPQRRGEKIRELAEKMREQTKKMQEYANATAGVGQIVRKIKEAP